MSAARRSLLVGAVAVAVVAAAVALVARDGDPALPDREVRAFLDAWAAGDAATVDRLAVAGSQPSRDQAAFRESLGIASSALEAGGVRRAAGGAGATVDATHRLRGLGEWRVRSHLRLVRQEGRRLVDWAPSGLHPDAEPGDAFERERSRPPRGEILGAGGQPLTVVGKVVSVGVQPARMTDQAAVATALQQHLGVDPARLDAALKAPHVEPDHFSVTAAGRLDDAALVAAAGRFGFGVAYSVGLGARNPADFPAPRDTAERAAAAIGQGRVLATPAHMASVAAAAVTGTWRGPVPARAGGGGGRDAAPVGARFAAAL